MAWYGGEELGNAMADILSGSVSPSGKLPCTFARLEDYPCSVLGTWPPRLIYDGTPPEVGHSKEQRRAAHAFDADYTEGRLIGYRWFQRRGTAPLFPFGFGLSYATFQITDPSAEAADGTIRFRCAVRNTGPVRGAETIQVYAGEPEPDAATPVRELKGFAKVALDPGEPRMVEVVIPPHALARYDEATGMLGPATGEVAVEAGTSSEKLFFKTTVEL